MALFGKKEEIKLPELPKLPSYEPIVSLNSIKEEVAREIPVRERGVMSLASRRDGEKPLFIKIDRYKEALNSIDEIKARIEGAEKLLNDLENINAEEDKKLQEWRGDIEDIKSKLLDIDKELFEV